MRPLVMVGIPSTVWCARERWCAGRLQSAEHTPLFLQRSFCPWSACVGSARVSQCCWFILKLNKYLVLTPCAPRWSRASRSPADTPFARSCGTIRTCGGASAAVSGLGRCAHPWWSATRTGAHIAALITSACRPRSLRRGPHNILRQCCLARTGVSDSEGVKVVSRCPLSVNSYFCTWLVPTSVCASELAATTSCSTQGPSCGG